MFPYYIIVYYQFMFSQLECGQLYKTRGHNLYLLPPITAYLCKYVVLLSNVFYICGNKEKKRNNDENHSARQRRNVCLKGWVILNLPFGSQQRWNSCVPLIIPWTTASMFIQVKWKWPLRNYLGHILTSISTILKSCQ